LPDQIGERWFVLSSVPPEEQIHEERSQQRRQCFIGDTARE